MNLSPSTSPAAPGDAQWPAVAAKAPAQGIECGALRLAFTYDWARAIVEDFSLTPVPNAPAWFIGASNVEGEIVPVFDLESWAGAGSPRAPHSELPRDKTRLLLGGRAGQRAAIAFSGEARMVRHMPGRRLQAGSDAQLRRLHEFVLAESDTTPMHAVIDAQRLFERLAIDIAA